jgi:hypothetical protein
MRAALIMLPIPPNLPKNSAKVSHIHWFPRTPTTPSGLILFDFGLR